MAGVMFLMLKKSSDRRQREAMERSFKVNNIPKQCQIRLFLSQFFAFYLQKVNEKYFQEADVDGDGFITVDEYYRILKEHGLQSSKEEIRKLIQMADKDNDG